jgi:Ca2+-transporting ATPase
VISEESVAGPADSERGVGSRARGLSPSEASARLAAEGPNALPADGPSSFWSTAWTLLREPMLLLLVVASALYLLLGDRLEAVMLMMSVGVVITIELVQERKTARALDALRNLASPRATVVRGGVSCRVPGRDVVRGDLLVVAEGERVAADARLLEASGLVVDESLLTGESVPVRKREDDGHGDAAPSRPGGDDLPLIFSGTLVVKGRGIAEVIATGVRSEIGQIGTALHAVESERTPLQREVAGMVRVMAVGAAGFSVALAVLYGLQSGSVVDGLLAGVALAMSLLPEELPIVLTVFFALGALRLARRGVLTRNLAALETLGAASILCTDKTGTLTENRMRITALYAGDEVHLVGEGELPASFREVLEHGILASQPQPFDPMEVAFHELGARALADTEHLHPEWRLRREYALSRELLSMANAWSPPGGQGAVVSAKGAPEAIVDLCRLSADEARAVRAAVTRFAAEGLRVLGVARARVDGERLLERQRDYTFSFVGLVGLADPVRASVPGAVADCHAAGIRVVMITGDYPVTASAIAQRAGLARPENALTGPEIETLDDDALVRRLQETDVVARAVPDQKLRIVRALARDGAVVAMTGDGVNDAPALEAAHIGVAMGGRGTDVAREAADLVLTDDDFTSIVAGVRSGRRIYDNLRKAVAYIVAVHVPVAGVAMIPALLGWPLALYPLHIVFLELVIDPACAIAFEAEGEEANIMSRPPRDARSRLADRFVLGLGAAQGATVLLACVAVLGVAYQQGLAEGVARALGFAALLGGNMGLILVNRSWTPGAHPLNPFALLVVLGATLSLAAVLSFAPTRAVFHFDPLPLGWAAAAYGLGVASIAWVEIWKRLPRGRSRLGAGASPARR